MSKLPLPNPLSDNMEVVFLAVRPPVPHPLDLNLSPWRLGFWLGEDSSGCPSVGGGAPFYRRTSSLGGVPLGRGQAYSGSFAATT
jgi:hypothetical protein